MIATVDDPGSGFADVCVVGSGPAGAVVAVELAERGFRVVLIEAGDDSARADVNEGIDKLDVGGTADVQFGRAVQLGGSSNLWAGRVAPLEAIDFEPRSWVPYSGWPFGVSELASDYDRALGLVGAPSAPNVADRPLATAWSSLVASGDVEAKMFSWAKHPFRVGPWLKDKAAAAKSLRIVTGAAATELVESGDRTITELRIRRASGETGAVRARTFVIAAGGIETVRILLNSRSGDAPGVGNEFGNVGRYFSTHPKADIAALVLPRRLRIDHPLFQDVSHATGRIRAGIGLTRDAQEQGRLINHYVQLSPLFEYRMSRVFEHAKGASAFDTKLIDRDRVVGALLPRVGLMAFEAISRMARLQPQARTFMLRAFLDQFPNADNRIDLSAARDQNGMRKANIHWRFSERDRQSVLDFLGVLDRGFSAHGVGRIEYKRIADLDDWPLTAIHSHFMGSTRMGADPRSSVVDRNCRIHGRSNVYIAGPSVFPTYGYANPFLTIAALSFRLARHLAEQLNR